MRQLALSACFSCVFVACNNEAPDASLEQPHTPVRMDSAAPAPPAAPLLQREDILGAWSSDGENFTWVIDTTSILLEIDMNEHPYQLVGDTLIIDRGDPVVGTQKTRIVRITADTLVIEDVLSGTRESLLRLR